jgi:hypothetical protein
MTIEEIERLACVFGACGFFHGAIHVSLDYERNIKVFTEEEAEEAYEQARDDLLAAIKQYKEQK